MLTLGQCRERRYDILVACDLCGQSRLLSLPEERTRFDDCTVGDLFEGGIIRCASHLRAATKLIVREVSGTADKRCLLETWPREAAEAEH